MRLKKTSSKTHTHTLNMCTTNIAVIHFICIGALQCTNTAIDHFMVHKTCGRWYALHTNIAVRQCKALQYLIFYYYIMFFQITFIQHSVEAHCIMLPHCVVLKCMPGVEFRAWQQKGLNTLIHVQKVSNTLYLHVL